MCKCIKKNIVLSDVCIQVLMLDYRLFPGHLSATNCIKSVLECKLHVYINKTGMCITYVKQFIIMYIIYKYGCKQR